MLIVMKSGMNGLDEDTIREFEMVVASERRKLTPKSTVKVTTTQSSAYNERSKVVDTFVTLTAVIERG